MTTPVKVNSLQVEDYLKLAYAQLERIARARTEVTTALAACESETAPPVFDGGRSALATAGTAVIAELDASALRLQKAIEAAGTHKDAQEQLSEKTAENFTERLVDHQSQV